MLCNTHLILLMLHLCQPLRGQQVGWWTPPKSRVSPFYNTLSPVVEKSQFSHGTMSVRKKKNTVIKQKKAFYMYLNKTGQQAVWTLHLTSMSHYISLMQDSTINNIHSIILLSKIDSNYFWYQQQVKTSMF